MAIFNGKKYCPACRKMIPIENFYRHKGQPDGLAGWCKPCYREYSRERHREQMRNGKKYCPACIKKVSIENSYQYREQSDIVASWCKPCYKEYMRKYHANPENQRKDMARYGDY